MTRPSLPARWRVAILGMVTGESSSMDLPVTRLADGDIGCAPGRPRCHQWPTFECCPHIHGPRRVPTTPVAGRWICGQEPASGRTAGRRGSLAAELHGFGDSRSDSIARACRHWALPHVEGMGQSPILHRRPCSANDSVLEPATMMWSSTRVSIRLNASLSRAVRRLSASLGEAMPLGWL